MRSLYINKKQNEFLQARQQFKMLVGGRGLGKTSIIAFLIYMYIKYLPRAKGFLVSSTYNQLLTKTMPAIIQQWSELGLREEEIDQRGHYVIGKRPPRHWKKPYSPPKKYDNVISFWNGLCIELISMDRPLKQKGGSYDFGIGDEIELVAEDHINSVMFPSLRGNRHKFSHYLHHMFSMFCNMPKSASGDWVLNYKQRMEQRPDKFYYLEGTAYDNIQVLGEAYVENLKLTLTYIQFQLQVMNKRVRRMPDAFYHALDRDTHGYKPAYKYGKGADGITVDGTDAIIRTKPLDLSVDFGGWFNGFTVWQKRGREERMVDCEFVLKGVGIDALVDNWCAKQADHKAKTVYVYGEPRGHDEQPTGDTFYDVLKKRFEKNGWRCIIKAKGGRTDNHEERFNLINEILKEENPSLPLIRINMDACEIPFEALEATQTRADGKKDKSKEKDRIFPQEYATHFPDTVDYFFMQKYGKSSRVLGLPGSAVFG